MYKIWLIYTEKGNFNGFKAIGFNDNKGLNFFKETFKDSHIFIETITKEEKKESEKTFEIGTLTDYGDFVNTLIKEGDTEIPSFEQYKTELEEEFGESEEVE